MEGGLIKYTPIEPEGVSTYIKVTSIIGYELTKFALASSILIFNTVNAFSINDTLRYTMDG